MSPPLCSNQSSSVTEQATLRPHLLSSSVLSHFPTLRFLFHTLHRVSLVLSCLQFRFRPSISLHSSHFHNLNDRGHEKSPGSRELKSVDSFSFCHLFPFHNNRRARFLSVFLSNQGRGSQPLLASHSLVFVWRRRTTRLFGLLAVSPFLSFYSRKKEKKNRKRENITNKLKKIQERR